MDSAESPLESPLRKLRLDKRMTLDDVRDAVKKNGGHITTGHLSIVERGGAWPSQKVVQSLVQVFAGEITELQILYPFKGSENEKVS